MNAHGHLKVQLHLSVYDFAILFIKHHVFANHIVIMECSATANYSYNRHQHFLNLFYQCSEVVYLVCAQDPIELLLLLLIINCLTT